jgi:hypothetical protein
MVWVAEGLQSCCSGLMELTTAAWVLLRIFLFGGLRDFFFFWWLMLLTGKCTWVG